MRPPPRVPCAHPSAPLTPSPSHQCALTSHFTLRAPQRDLNAFSSTPMRSYCALHPTRFLAHSPSPPHQCALTAHFNLGAFSCAHPIGSTNMRNGQRLLASHALRAQPWLSSPPRLERSPRATVAFEVFHLPPTLASRAKRVGPVRSCPPTAAALPELKE